MFVLCSRFFFLVCFCLLSIYCIHPIAAYQHGDPVSIVKRSQYKGFRTEWSDIPHQDGPSFGITRAVSFSPLSSSFTLTSTSDEYKLQFALSDERFLTTWITLTDGKAHWLEGIDFIITYKDTSIHDIKVKTTYHSDQMLKPDHIFLRYHWKELEEADPNTGMNFLLITSIAIAWCFGALIAFDLDRAPTASSSTDTTKNSGIVPGSASKAAVAAARAATRAESVTNAQLW